MNVRKQTMLVLSLILMCSCAGSGQLRRGAEVPAEKIAVLAGQIEDAVLNMATDKMIALEDERDQLADWPQEDIDFMGPMVGLDEIQRQIPAISELNIDNEVVLAAIRGRILRRPAIKEFEDTGCVGENRRGLLQYLGSKWCVGTRRYRDRASFIVLNDNRDRRVIYEHLIEANGLSGSAITQIREIFAQQIYKKAWAGTPLQMPDGTWERR